VWLYLCAMAANRSLSLRWELFVSALRRKRGSVFHNSKGAVNGYDVVAYFTEGKPAMGRKQISHRWNGAIWYFSSETHRALFAAHPDRYAPQFGGFCAYGVRNGYKIHTDPAAWTILKGKLYLNYSLSVQEKWRRNPEAFVAEGNGNWKNLKTKY